MPPYTTWSWCKSLRCAAVSEQWSLSVMSVLAGSSAFFWGAISLDFQVPVGLGPSLDSPLIVRGEAGSAYGHEIIMRDPSWNKGEISI